MQLLVIMDSTGWYRFAAAATGISIQSLTTCRSISRAHAPRSNLVSDALFQSGIGHLDCFLVVDQVMHCWKVHEKTCFLLFRRGSDDSHRTSKIQRRLASHPP